MVLVVDGEGNYLHPLPPPPLQISTHWPHLDTPVSSMISNSTPSPSFPSFPPFLFLSLSLAHRGHINWHSPIVLILIPLVLNSVCTVIQLGRTYCHSLIALILIPFIINTGWGILDILPFSYCSYSYLSPFSILAGAQLGHTYILYSVHIAIVLLLLFSFLSFYIICTVLQLGHTYTVSILLLLFSFSCSHFASCLSTYLPA